MIGAVATHCRTVRASRAARRACGAMRMLRKGWSDGETQRRSRHKNDSFHLLLLLNHEVLALLVPGNRSSPQQRREIYANTEGKNIRLKMNAVQVRKNNVHRLRGGEIEIGIEAVVAINGRAAGAQCVI